MSISFINKDHGTNFVSFAPVHIEPLAIYSQKIKDLKDLPNGAKVAIPSDPTNSARALLLLQSAGLNPTKDGLFVEKADSPYANLLSVNPGDENKPAIQKLAKALQSPEIKKFIEEHYNGAIIPAF